MKKSKAFIVKRSLHIFLLFVFVSTTLLFYQNCGKGFTSLAENASSSFSSLAVVDGPGTSKLRRLSNSEYRNSLSDVIIYQFGRQNKTSLGETLMSGDAIKGKLEILPQDVSTKRLGTDQLSAFLSPTRFAAYVEIANAVADLLTNDPVTLKAFVGSCANQNGDVTNVVCINTFIQNFGQLVFRAQLKPEELSELKIGIKSWKDLIGRLLIHARFINHFEREGELIGSNGVYKLNSYEIEARLCAVFWKSVPDVQGLTVAATGALNTSTGLRKEIKRILGSPKAQETLWQFYQQWLASSRIPDVLNPNDPAYTAFSNNLNVTNYKANALQDGKDFLNYITWTANGKLEDIFKSPLIFTMDPIIASIYGVSPRTISTQAPTNDVSGNYKGILTRPMITAQKPSVSGDTNPILRGVFLVTNIIGMELGNPANFGDQNAAASAVPDGASARTEVTIKTAASTCIGCHSIINPSGFALGHYDSIGRYSNTEKRWRVTSWDPLTVANIATNPIDSNTSLVLNGVTYNITDVPSLVDALFKSGRVYDAFSRYYFRFAFGRIEDAQSDAAFLNDLKKNLQSQSIQEALESMAMHPDFLRVKASK